MNKFDFFSPIDFRYCVEELAPYLSEEGFTKYKGKLELALVKALAEHNLCSQDDVSEIEKAVDEINSEEVYDEENRIKHDIRALVNMIRKRVSDKAKPFVHLTATSYDIIDSTNALRFKHAVKNVILPDMIDFEETLINIARREKDTLQIGRTHGQHAEPITFGFAIAQYVNRFGERILKVNKATHNLVGKFSGAVGAYNASSLLFDNPDDFEAEILANCKLNPAFISTQIVPPEPTLDFIHAVVSSFGVLANYARDMRNLQRTEIGEIGEPFGEEQVGSSTMPQKRNPINFENIESAWKEFMPRIITHYMDQISEHQRDLTNSLTQRFIPELLMMFDSSVRRATKISKKLRVDETNMKRNFKINADKIVAEPLQILLSFYGHPNAHEKVRQLIMDSYRTNMLLTQIINLDRELCEFYLPLFSESQKEIILHPEKYIGIASKKAEQTADYWKERLKNLKNG